MARFSWVSLVVFLCVGSCRCKRARWCRFKPRFNRPSRHPFPELSVVQALSATILVTTVLQGYAVPMKRSDGRFNFDLRFDGGLPTINGRELPRIPGL